MLLSDRKGCSFKSLVSVSLRLVVSECVSGLSESILAFFTDPISHKGRRICTRCTFLWHCWLRRCVYHIMHRHYPRCCTQIITLWTAWSNNDRIWNFWNTAFVILCRDKCFSISPKGWAGIKNWHWVSIGCSAILIRRPPCADWRGRTIARGENRPWIRSGDLGDRLGSDPCPPVHDLLYSSRWETSRTYSVDKILCEVLTIVFNKVVVVVSFSYLQGLKLTQFFSMGLNLPSQSLCLTKSWDQWIRLKS